MAIAFSSMKNTQLSRRGDEKLDESRSITRLEENTFAVFLANAQDLHVSNKYFLNKLLNGRFGGLGGVRHVGEHGEGLDTLHQIILSNLDSDGFPQETARREILDKLILPYYTQKKSVTSSTMHIPDWKFYNIRTLADLDLLPHISHSFYIIQDEEGQQFKSGRSMNELRKRIQRQCFADSKNNHDGQYYFGTGLLVLDAALLGISSSGGASGDNSNSAANHIEDGIHIHLDKSFPGKLRGKTLNRDPSPVSAELQVLIDRISTSAEAMMRSQGY